MKDSGAEVLRLWVSMVDYRDEVRLGKEVLARTVEAYRKIRNTFRYLLVEPVRLRSRAATRVADAQLLEVDRFALAVYAPAGRSRAARRTTATTSRRSSTPSTSS